MSSTPVSHGNERSGPTAPTSNDSRISAAPDKMLQSTAGSRKPLKTYSTRSGRKLLDSTPKENVPIAESKSRSRAPRPKSSREVVISPPKKQKTIHPASEQEEEEREWDRSDGGVALPKSLSLSQNDDTIPFSKNHKIDSHVPNEENIQPKVEVIEERDGNGIGGENLSTEKGKGKEKEIEAIEAKPKLEDDGEALMPTSNLTLSGLPRSSGPSPEPEPETLVMKRSHSTLPQHSSARATQDYTSSSSKILARSVSIISEASTATSGSSVKVRKRSIVQDEEDWEMSGVSPLNKQFKMEHGSKNLSRTVSLTPFTSSPHLRQLSPSAQRYVSIPSTSKRNTIESALPPNPSNDLEAKNNFAMPFALPCHNVRVSSTPQPHQGSSSRATPSISTSPSPPSSSLEAELLKLGEGFSFLIRGQLKKQQLDFLAPIFRDGGYDTGENLRCLESWEAKGIIASLRERYEKDGCIKGSVAEVDWTRMINQFGRGLEKKDLEIA